MEAEGSTCATRKTRGHAKKPQRCTKKRSTKTERQQEDFVMSEENSFILVSLGDIFIFITLQRYTLHYAISTSNRNDSSVSR